MHAYTHMCTGIAARSRQTGFVEVAIFRDIATRVFWPTKLGLRVGARKIFSANERQSGIVSFERHTTHLNYEQGCQELVAEKCQTLFKKEAKLWILLNNLLGKKAKH